MNDFKTLVSRFEQAKAENEKHKATWQDLSKYANPSLSLLFDKDDTASETYAKDVYDSTAINALRTMTDGLIGNMVSKASPWVELRAIDPELDKKPSNRLVLQDINRRLYAVLARTNFYNMLPTYVSTCLTIATATMFVEEDVKTTQAIFSVRHPKEVFIAKDWYGNINEIYRSVMVPAQAAANFFVDNKSALSKDLLDKVNDSPFELVRINHAVFPTNDNYFQFPGVSKKFGNVYWEDGAKDIIVADGYDYFPFVTWRYRVEGNETYGRGPTHDAYADIKGINTIKKTLLKAANLSADPPLNIPAEMKGQVQNKPRGANYYRDPGRVVERWRVEGNYPVGNAEYESVKSAIEDVYYVPFWKMLSQLTQRMTSYEVQQRKGEQATLISVPASRFESEALDNLLNIVYNIEARNKRMPPVPAELLSSGVQWQYNGALAQLQRKSIISNAITTTLNDISLPAQMDPSSMMALDLSKAVRIIANNDNFPAEAIVSEIDVEKQKQAIQQAQQQAQQAQDVKNMGQGLPGMTEGMKGLNNGVA